MSSQGDKICWDVRARWNRSQHKPKPGLQPPSRLAGPQHSMRRLTGIACTQAHLHTVKEASRAARGHHRSGAGQLEDISIGDLGAGRQLQSKAWRQGQGIKGWRSEGQGHARAGAARCRMSSCSCARCAHEVGNPLSCACSPPHTHTKLSKTCAPLRTRGVRCQRGAGQ